MFYGDSSAAGYVKWDLGKGRIGYSQGLTDLWGGFLPLQQLSLHLSVALT